MPKWPACGFPSLTVPDGRPETMLREAYRLSPDSGSALATETIDHGKMCCPRRAGCSRCSGRCRERARRQLMPPDARREGPDGDVRRLPERLCRAGRLLRVRAANPAAERREGMPARHDGPARRLRSHSLRARPESRRTGWRKDPPTPATFESGSEVAAAGGMAAASPLQAVSLAEAGSPASFVAISGLRCHPERMSRSRSGSLPFRMPPGRACPAD